MIRELPDWMAEWLGVESTTAGEGTAWGLANSWNWAPWLILAFALATVAYVGILYWREGGPAGKAQRVFLAILRLAVIGLVLFMIAEWLLTLSRTGLPYVVVIVDDSASMAIVDRYDDDKLSAAIAGRLKAVGLTEMSRINLAKTALLEDDLRLLKRLAEDYKLKVYFVSDSAREQSGRLDQAINELRKAEATGETSQLGHGLRAVLNDLRGAPPAAIIFMTDGITTEGESLSEAAVYARRKNVPVFTIGLGSESPIKDLELSDLLADEVVFVNDVINFEFTLRAAGFNARDVKVTLKRNGVDAPLAEQTVSTGADGDSQKLRLAFRPMEVGEYEFTVDVNRLPDELRHDNNRLTQLVSVRDEPIKVLLVQEYPSYEFRRLKEMLLRERTVTFRYVQQDADTAFVDEDRRGERASLPTFPVRREELFDYDVVIFGDVNPTLLGADAINHLREFVMEKGGGLIMFAGSQHTPLAYRNTPLAELIPVELSSAALPPLDALSKPGRVEPTDVGLSKPQMQLGDSPVETADIWRKLPGIFWCLETQNLKPAAQVLAEHESRLTTDGRKLPVFVYRITGAGKVLFHATDETNRWRARIGDKHFARYWLQAIRYLSRGKLLGDMQTARLVTDRTKYRRGEPVIFQLRFIDERRLPTAADAVTVMYERQGEGRRPVKLARSIDSPTVFEGQVTGLVEGQYHASVIDPSLAGEPAADFQVLPPPGETERVQMDVAELTRTARDTRGKFYRFADTDRLLDDLPEGRPVTIESLPPTPLWNKWPVLAAFLLLITTEWLLRKRSGML
jgi:uncharacterized membrane protein